MRAAPPALLLTLTLAVTGSAGFVAGYHPLGDGDVFWVAAAGREMIASGRLPTTNGFSFTEPLHPWLMHEWLLGPAYAWILETFGPAGFAPFSVLQAAICIAIVAASVASETRSVRGVYALTLAGVFLFGGRLLTLRPTHVALLLAVAFAAVVLRPGLTWRRAALVFALEVLWTNVHGSFVLGGFLTAASALIFPTERRPRGILALALLVGTLVNPHGLALHRFVADYFAGQSGVFPVIRAQIGEFAPLYAKSPIKEPLTFVAFLALALAAMRASLDPRFRWRGLTAGALALLALRSVRMLDLAGLVGLLVLAPSLADGIEREPGPLARPPLRIAALLAAPALVAGLVGFVARLASGAPVWFADDVPGGQWTHALAQVPDGADLYVPFSMAGATIWYGSPRGIRVFYDPRNDCYSAGVARAAFALEGGAGGTEAATRLLQSFGTSHVLVPRNSAIGDALMGATGYAVVWRDADVLLFARRAPSA